MKGPDGLVSVSTMLSQRGWSAISDCGGVGDRIAWGWRVTSIRNVGDRIAWGWSSKGIRSGGDRIAS